MEFNLIICSSTLEEEIMGFFKSSGITSYTVLPMAVGSGNGGGTRFDNEIWPGQNMVIMVCLHEKQHEALRNLVSEYRKNDIREGLKLFTLGLKEVI